MPRLFNFDFYFGVNVRVLCVAGTEGGGTPGCLIMGNGLLVEKKNNAVAQRGHSARRM